MARKQGKPLPIATPGGLGPFEEGGGDLNVVIETPKGRRNKYDFDPVRNIYRLKGMLPAGSVFPYDFGFIPGTLGEDGDPLDVLVLMDEPAYPGCVVTSRLIGVIEAEQTENGRTERNDRLVAVAACSATQQEVRALGDLDAHLLEEITHFFVSYNRIKGKEFRPLGPHGPKRARKLVEAGVELAEKRGGRS